jgi:transcriptional regulator with XRE-family HTH domain
MIEIYNVSKLLFLLYNKQGVLLPLLCFFLDCFKKRSNFAASNQIESTMIDIRKRVNELCKERGVTQMELADKMGITRVALSISLRPDRKTKKAKEGANAITYPSMETLKRIADALEIEVEDIFATDEVVSRHQANVSNSIRCPYCGAELELSKNPSNMTGEEIKAEIERLKAMVTDEPNYRLLTSEELAELEKMRQEWNATHEEQIP